MIKTEVNQMNWYTVKVQNKREKSVSERLKLDMKRDFNEDINILIPTQNLLVIKNGKKVEDVNLLYPGYVFIETQAVDKLNHLIKSTVGATNVLKDTKGKAVVLRQSEVERMIGIKEAPATTAPDLFTIGEKVMILEGPFQNFKGEIESIDKEKERIKVEVLLFGRKNMVDLAITDVVKHND
jgi:transcriptional antiterminator NusG